MRFIVSFLVVLLVAFGVSAPAIAQDASPTAQESLLAGFGFPDLVMDTDGLDYTMTDSFAAGRYHFVINDSSPDRSTDVVFAQVPDGMTPDELIALSVAADEQGVVADEIYSLTIAGGAYAWPSSVGDSIITLGPGDWVVDFQTYSEVDESIELVELYRSITVTGELPTLTDPPADVVATASELQFNLPESIPTGPQIWKFTNAGSFLHHMIIQRYPEPVTSEQIQATLNSVFGVPATPAASPVAELDLDEIVFVNQAQLLSNGQANWLALDLDPGTYFVLCFMSGPGEVPPHALMGMYKILTVA